MHRVARLCHAGIASLVGLRRRASRHDLVLAIIPVAFLFAGVLGTTMPVGSMTAVMAGALVSGLAMLDALFFNPPTDPSAG